MLYDMFAGANVEKWIADWCKIEAIYRDLSPVFPLVFFMTIISFFTPIHISLSSKGHVSVDWSCVFTACYSSATCFYNRTEPQRCSNGVTVCVFVHF